MHFQGWGWISYIYVIHIHILIFRSFLVHDLTFYKKIYKWTASEYFNFIDLLHKGPSIYILHHHKRWVGVSKFWFQQEKRIKAKKKEYISSFLWKDINRIYLIFTFAIKIMQKDLRWKFYNQYCRKNPSANWLLMQSEHAPEVILDHLAIFPHFGLFF